MIIVMGIPGAGKTTVLNSLKLGDYIILNYGDLMFDEAKKLGIVDRDSMRKQSPEFQKKLQKKVVEVIISKGEKVIIDTHCSVKTPVGYLPGLPYDIISKFKVSHLVLVTAKPEELQKRRQKDITRKRDEDSLDQIREHDSMNRYLLAAYAFVAGATMQVIENSEGKLEDAVAKLQRILD